MKKVFKNEFEEMKRIITTSSFYVGLQINAPYGAPDEDGERPYEEEFYAPAQGGWTKTVTDQYGGGFTTEEDGVFVTDEELLDRLQNLEDNDEVIIVPMGTHCGSMKFLFGWVHNKAKTKEEIEEAVMPQHD